jgi:hypothetical protein
MIFAALILASVGMAAATPGDPSVGSHASLPEGLFEAVREALGPQAAAVLVGPAQPIAQQAKLNAADAEASDFFGFSVALDGDTAVVGAYQEDPDLGGGPLTGAGSAYVFVRSGSTWSQQAKLNADDAEAGDEFGQSVAISGDTVLVGARLEDPDMGGGPLTDAGSVYVFTRNGMAWDQQAKLNADDAEADDRFGYSVALDGDTAVVGAYQEDPDLGGGPLTGAGSAYVFVRSGTTWSQEAKLNAADAEAEDVFGVSVAISGDTVLIGAHREGPDLGGGPINLAGSAYVFVASAPPPTNTPVPPTATPTPTSTPTPTPTSTPVPPTATPIPTSTPTPIGTPTAMPIPSFIDVPADHWAWQFVEAIFSAGLTAGFPDGTYRPDNPVTRAEMAVFLKKGIHGSTYSPPPLDGSHPFSDIAGHWAEAWIEDLFDEGFTSGFPDGTYRPDNQVTRAETPVFLMKVLHGETYVPPAPAGGSGFSDIAGHWAEAWIGALLSEAITGGYPDGTYRPENKVTRAEMAVFLVNAFSLPLP